ncbi:MAG: DUF1282 family protein [Pseudomonadales bacterium]|nr:DUF1282 family protein [Pseudomonadales bacterium]
MRYLRVIACRTPRALYFGSTQVGGVWSGREIRLVPESAMQIMMLFYLAILVGILVLGYMVHWMSETYEAEDSSFSKGVGIAAYTCTPMFVCGLIGFYPILWLDIMLGIGAACYTVYLLYLGVPIVMDIPKERGFLFASAMVAVGLVLCAAMMGATVILWELGAMPVFTD